MMKQHLSTQLNNNNNHTASTYESSNHNGFSSSSSIMSGNGLINSNSSSVPIHPHYRESPLSIPNSTTISPHSFQGWMGSEANYMKQNIGQSALHHADLMYQPTFHENDHTIGQFPDHYVYKEQLGFSIEQEKQKLRDIGQFRERIKQKEIAQIPSTSPLSPPSVSTHKPPQFSSLQNQDFDRKFKKDTDEEKDPLNFEYTYSSPYMMNEEGIKSDGKIPDGVSNQGGRENSVEFLSMRIAALEEIIEIQNNEINEFNNNSKGKDSKEDVLRKGKHSLQISLINKWRHKVYALLIQMKMREIELENAKKEFQQHEADHEKEIKQLKYELTLSKHREKDMKASVNYLQEQLKQVDTTKYMKEIDRLNREREFMKRKYEQDLKLLKDDRNMIEEQQKTKQDETKRKFEELSKELEVVRKDFETKCSEVEKLNLSLVRAEQTIANELSVVKTLKSKLTDYQQQSDREKNNMVFNAIRLKDEELTRLEIELNESKSENAKLTYKLRHYERLLQAEQESRHKEDKEKFDYYEMKLAAKEEELKQLKKERSSLLLTIRHQEEMLENRRKKERAQPIQPSANIDVKSSSIIPREYLSISNNLTSPKASPKPPIKEPTVMSSTTPNSQLSEKLKDLSSLTRKFLEKSSQQLDDEYL
ncbi:hypothetical protein C9374_012491 [Naegleria lovaniensis]|uniref:Coiled-coil alpha-helical rod protein 1 n=1 Tax=Naegleria lovaniensis TaxID=51637 RepID=A0AA88H220_NAELO|nr:uncharacterized protein C9374_012491 [Naegleria lovaniensis]KAG2392239.1 hypothetical protein C9374_012491 [Naegleria lovaniensis]